MRPNVVSGGPGPGGRNVFTGNVNVQIILRNYVFTILALITFFLNRALKKDLRRNRAITFVILTLSRIIRTFGVHSSHSLFGVKPFSGDGLGISILVSITLVTLILFAPLRAVFNLMVLAPGLCLVTLKLVFIPLIIVRLSGLLKLVHRGWGCYTSAMSHSERNVFVFFVHRGCPRYHGRDIYTRTQQRATDHNGNVTPYLAIFAAQGAISVGIHLKCKVFNGPHTCLNALGKWRGLMGRLSFRALRARHALYEQDILTPFLTLCLQGMGLCRTLLKSHKKRIQTC